MRVAMSLRNSEWGIHELSKPIFFIIRWTDCPCFLNQAYVALAAAAYFCRNIAAALWGAKEPPPTCKRMAIFFDISLKGVLVIHIQIYVPPSRQEKYVGVTRFISRKRFVILFKEAQISAVAAENRSQHAARWWEGEEYINSAFFFVVVALLLLF